MIDRPTTDAYRIPAASDAAGAETDSKEKEPSK